MPVSNQLKNQHLLWRGGFGPMFEDQLNLAKASPKDYVKALFKSSSKTPAYIDVADNAIKGIVMGVDEIKKQQLTEEQRKKLREQSRKDIKSLNLAWLSEMVNSQQQLREKMSLFWHGHFASRNLNILYQQQLLDIIRRNALGSFGDLLMEVSKSAAMINFLNNNQNRKDNPNENFAREVMELFTLGRGHYTETDVKEAARAFTGWGANISGEFVFRKFQHDSGEKTVLGQSGKLSGEDVLKILLSKKQTSYFITKKIYRYFVNEEVDESKLNFLADRFFESNYNITALMTDIFNSDWFYEEKNIGSKIKSPIELIAGIQRALPMEWQNPDVQLLIQRLLGQLLFYPPNVAGWPGGKNWIDSSSLMLRLKLPQLISSAGELTIKPKDDDDQMMGRKDANLKAMGKLGGQLIGAAINWETYFKNFKSIARENLTQALLSQLLQNKLSVPENVLVNSADSSSRENFIRSTTINIMSTPEYQLC